MRYSRFTLKQSVAGLMLLAALISGCATTAPTLDLESAPTAEGLYEVSGIDADQAWARSDADMAQYSKLHLESIDIQFRPGGEGSRSQIVRNTGGPYEVSGEQAEEYRAIADQEIAEEFAKSRRFTLVDEAGPDVLAVTVRLEDVTSNIPPEQLGQLSIYIAEFGEATIMLELRDSMSAGVVARISDRHTAENIDPQVRANPAITPTTEIERMFRLFGRQMRQQLEELASLGE